MVIFFKNLENLFFMICELIINMIIFVDFVLKVWLKVRILNFKGFWTYMTSVSNIFDFIVVVGCIGTFALYLSSK